jgi:hypothetical protein
VAKRGRPTDYSEDLGLRICDLLSDGLSLRKICARADMPAKITVLKWLGRIPDFAAHYAWAREMQADVGVDEMQEIADNPKLDPADKRVRIDTRKWIAAKMRPKKYGDRVDLGVSGTLTLESLVTSSLPPAPSEE